MVPAVAPPPPEQRMLFFSVARPVIGMVHLRALLGSAAGEPVEQVYKDALTDALTLAEGGVDGIMIENNYDLPHRERILPETLAVFTAAAQRIRSALPTLPLGICVLWNDYRASFAIARAVGAQFIRVPALVDSVRTAYGDMLAHPEEVKKCRAELGAEGIALFADIHVKHAELLSPYSVAESATRAVEAGADALIVTGKWTGDPPTREDLTAAQGSADGVPIVIGSGGTAENVGRLLEDAQGIIVGTALKQGYARSKEEQVNLKSSDQRIGITLVRDFMRAARIASRPH